jgi:hypothetical protein
MNNKLLCPHCNQEIELSEAFRHQIEEEIGKELTQKHRRELLDLEKKTSERIRKTIEEELKVEQEDLKRELAEKNKRLSAFREQELELRKEKRELEDQKRDMVLDVEKRVSEEKKQIEASVTKRIDEEHRLKELEKEKLISDLKKSLEEAQRKAQQGSQQLQGEILELDLEEMLRQEFPFDTIEPVGKGVKGADVRQVVKSKMGSFCGVILWEFKRTKSWQDGWIQKLKDDLRSEGANIPVIVTNQLPKTIELGIGCVDGVWICTSNFVVILATLLRDRLYEVAKEKHLYSKKGTKAEQVYELVTGHEFQQQVQAQVETYNQMKDQIRKERGVYEKVWKTRESQVERMFLSTVNIYGTLQGLVGPSMPRIEGLEIESLESGE